ncbi:MAG TPA: SdpI family protein [Thermoanaerobaculia bacterium]|nr:SdpI family protein [Thermoanaerobaculia bacterium]
MVPVLPLLFAGIGLLLIGLSVPLIRRRVKPNALYGLRVPATFADEWVWYEANARSGRDLLLLGTLQIVAASLPLWIPGLSEAAYALTNAGLVGIGALLLCIVGWLRANRLLREQEAGRSLSTGRPRDGG